MEKDVQDALTAYVRDCGNPRASDALPAVLAGLLAPAPLGSASRYIPTEAGNAAFVARAIENGATPEEAERSLDFLV